MKELLFDAVTLRQEPSTKSESTFQFLERDGRVESIEIRHWMEKWFQEYPEGQRTELKKRFKSKDSAKFTEAYFELQVFAMLRLLDCDVKVHPDFDNTGSTVDFEARNGESRFYVEATVCGFNKGALHSNANEEDAARKIKENLHTPHSDIWLSAEGELSTTLPGSRVIEPFQELLNKYTVDQVKQRVLALGLVHAQQHLSISIEEGNWRLEGFLAPPIASNGQGQVFGPSRGGAVDGAEPLQRTLVKKVDDWKQKRLANEIFVIAVNACHSEFSWGDERSAVFENCDLDSDENTSFATLSRVNGVIVFDHAVLGAERDSRVKLYRNGSMPIPDCLEFLVCEQTLGELLGFYAK